MCLEIKYRENNIFPPFSNIKRNFVADCIIATEVNDHKHSDINNTDLSCNSENQNPHMGPTGLNPGCIKCGFWGDAMEELISLPFLASRDS